MLTSTALVRYFETAVNEKWGYVWGLNGELYTEAMAREFKAAGRSTSSSRNPATYWTEDCRRWFGKIAADCSGGIVGAIRTADPKYKDRTANTFYSECTEKGPISTLPERPGACVWRSGHIGIYEGGGYALEFRGTEYGAVRTKVSERDFTHWGLLRDIDYGGGAEPDKPRIITLTTPYMRGDDIKTLQAALNSLGYNSGAADGIAGKKTVDAIAAFAQAHGGAALPNELIISVLAGSKT